MFAGPLAASTASTTPSFCSMRCSRRKCEKARPPFEDICRPLASLFCHPNPSPQARAPPVPSFSRRLHSPLRPLRPHNPLCVCVLRQVELSFMMGPGAGQVRRLLLALQEAGSPGHDGAAAAALNAGWTPSARDTQVGEIYLSELERLGQLHVREEWLREQLA